MKIEIEYEEIEKLRDKINEQSEKIKEWEAYAKSVDENELKGRAVYLAEKMCDSVLTKIFNEIGFENIDGALRSEYGFKNLIHWLGKDFYDHKDLEVTIGANITNKFRGAFIKLGIKTKV